MLPKLPLGTQTFSKIRESGRCYVDKTAIIHRMITSGSDAVFLSRPRRFGKSLVCSTIAAIYSGDRKLFGEIAGRPALAIDSLDWGWEKHPVIMLSMRARARGSNTVQIAGAVNCALQRAAVKHRLDIRGEHVDAQFENLILDMYARYDRRVVVTVDEYDAPLLNSIRRPKSMEKTQEFLRELYGVMKTCDELLEFVFITGVTKFSHVSIFSGMNQPDDISLDPDYADICGFTQEEIEQNFAPRIAQIRARRNESSDEYMDKLRRYYNGYRFTKEPTTLYNPFGMLLHFKSRGEYFPYWYQSGTPTFLADLIKNQRINVANLGKLQIDCADLRESDAARLDATGMLYQAGYLTITGYDERRDRFTLDYPNIEVKSAFAKTLIRLHLGVQTEPARSLFEDLPHYLVQGKIRAALRAISECLASIDYEITEPLEFYYETAIVLIFRIFGLDCRPEVRLAAGRIDALVETSAYVYCFEFKLDNDAGAALAQINRKGYLTPWRGTGKKLFKVGVGIDKKIRNIGNVEIRVIRPRVAGE